MLSIPPFIVTIMTLVKYSRSLISRSELFCGREYLVAPTFETSVQRVFRGFLQFFKLSYNTFQLFPGWIKKKRVFKNWIHICFSPFSLYLKINMDKTSQKVTEDKDPKRFDAGYKGRENFMKKNEADYFNWCKKKLAEMLPIQEMKLPALPTPPPEDQMILMSMALVYLLSLPLALVYFLHITLLSLKNSSVKKRSTTKMTSYALEKYTINE